jgi:Protein of unknown function (DUF2934)
MNLEVADLQKEKEKLRRRLLGDQQIRERISFRAYEIYQRRGSENGCALEDWLQAEDEIVSSVMEQELQPPSESDREKHLKRNGSKSSQSRAESTTSQLRTVSALDTASNRKTKTRQPEPISSTDVEGKGSTGRAPKKRSDASARRKGRKGPEE